MRWIHRHDLIIGYFVLVVFVLCLLAIYFPTLTLR